MNRDMKFSEMLHGNIHWAKGQETVSRPAFRQAVMQRKSVLMLDTEMESLENYLWKIWAYQSAQVFLKPRAVLDAESVAADLSKRNPALAAEHRYTEMARGGSAVNLMQIHEARKVALREWRRLNWGYYWGRGFEDV